LDFMVCDKVEKNVSEELSKHPTKIQGFTSLQDIESTDCDGKKTLAPKVPINDFSVNLTIEPPAGLNSKVTYATIENSRTCAARRLDVKSGEAPLPDSPEWLAHPYWINDQGRIVIGTNDSMMRMQIGLNVASGQNILNITYYGRCLEKPDDKGICRKAEELARKAVLVNAEIEKREVNGVFTINTCRKTPPAK
jgi:hypothetical protein